MADVILDATTTTSQVLDTTADHYFLLEGVTHYVTASFAEALTISATDTDVLILGSMVSLGFRPIFIDSLSDNASIFIGASGSITGRESQFILKSDAENTSITNAGTMSGGQLELDSANATLINAGSIFGTIDTSSNISAILFDGGGDYLDNSGSIQSVGVWAIQTRSDLTLLNTGTITGEEVGVYANLTSSSEVVNITNSGIIGGSIASIELGSADDIVSNAGQLLGDVFLGSGADRYLGSGDGLVAGTVYGEIGDDILNGGSQNDILDGGSDNDVIRGRSGDDDLFGGFGEDILRGGSGTNSFDGGANADVMFGQKDAIDTFIWLETTDSLSAETDTVRGFTQGEDTLDLSELVLGQIEYMGANAFSGTGASLRVTEGPNNSVVRIDVDGDGSNDMRIFVATFGMTELDFIL